jgi:hypothetical protein
VLAYIGAVGAFITVPVAAEVGTGPLRLLWLLVPAAVFAARLVRVICVAVQE